MSPSDLDEALRAALERPRWSWRRPLRLRRYVVWLSRPDVRISLPGGFSWSWRSKYADHRGHGFTRAQARGIRKALDEVMRTEHAQAHARLLAILQGHATQ